MDFPDVFAERLETYRSLIFRKDKIYTHPKVAAAFLVGLKIKMSVSTHSRPKVAAPLSLYVLPQFVFQHTATRRWLRRGSTRQKRRKRGFNTQPRGGGCRMQITHRSSQKQFQHTAARRRLHLTLSQNKCLSCSFQHTAARRRLRGGIWRA